MKPFHWILLEKAGRTLYKLSVLWPQMALLRLRGMKVGTGCAIGRVQANKPYQVAIGDHTAICRGVDFRYVGDDKEFPHIRIGRNCHIGVNTTFNCSLDIEIADFVMLADNCYIVDADHTFAQLDMPIGQQDGRLEKIVIEKNVWMGAGVTILRGVHIGEGAVVGAGAVITKNIGALEIWAGVPARKIGTRAI